MPIPHISDPLREIISRIKRETGASGKLYPCTFSRVPFKRVEGDQQLPNITLQNFSDEDEPFMAGAKQNTALSANVVKTTQTLTFFLCFNMDNGIYSEDGDSQLGLMDWVARFKDTIEINDEGCQDLTLNGTCLEPLYTSLQNTELEELSWVLEFIVTLYPKPLARGSRSLPSS